MQTYVRRFLTLFLFLLISLGALAQDKKSENAEKKNKPKEVVLVGRVVDSECYMKMGEMGVSEDHHNCAEACAEGGIPLAFLEEKTGELFFTANEGMTMKSANKTLMPYIDERVSVKGKVVERSGAKLLIIGTVEKVK